MGIDTKCGEQDPIMYMFYGEANFRFRSDLSISAAGFQAQYDGNLISTNTTSLSVTD